MPARLKFFQSGGKWLFPSPAMLAGGWLVNGVLTAMSGPPLNFSNIASQINAPGTTNTPDIVGDFKILGGIGPGDFWFDPAAFRAPPANVPGNVGRNILKGPKFFDTAFSVFRRFRLGERTSAEFRFESFNFTNTPPYAAPNAELGNANFGRITGLLGDSVGNPRTMQFGLRLLF